MMEDSGDGSISKKMDKAILILGLLIGSIFFCLTLAMGGINPGLTFLVVFSIIVVAAYL